MNSTLKKFTPFLLILLGLLILFLDLAEFAGIILLIGIVMVVESFWPEDFTDGEKVRY